MDRRDRWTTGTAELASDVRLHYLLAGDGPQTVLLIHGYPQTHWQWRHVVGPLVEAGYRVVAADYRGAGGSSKPNVGYDKRTMAEDLHRLVRREQRDTSGPIDRQHDA